MEAKLKEQEKLLSYAKEQMEEVNEDPGFETRNLPPKASFDSGQDKCGFSSPNFAPRNPRIREGDSPEQVGSEYNFGEDHNTHQRACGKGAQRVICKDYF